MAEDKYKLQPEGQGSAARVLKLTINGVEVIMQVVGITDQNGNLLAFDNSGRPTVNVAGTIPISASALPLPSGAANAANQEALAVLAASLLQELQLKADLTETQPVSGPLTLAQLLTSLPLQQGLIRGPVYVDANYLYFGEGIPGTNLPSPGWRVRRVAIATGMFQYADGNTYFDNVFTDLATVAAMSFS